ncbi:hypothetical protein E2C01_056396 [Portunus trituberculatus]|uniref:Uncharacterized protein n=1 Tax=Portunus trituberculatus TaxID=210409 RepID=A0A5B7GU05_PORTR|nr:hypothetical protein [Portunus trituberculatus]
MLQIDILKRKEKIYERKGNCAVTILEASFNTMHHGKPFTVSSVTETAAVVTVIADILSFFQYRSPEWKA